MSTYQPISTYQPSEHYGAPLASSPTRYGHYGACKNLLGPARGSLNIPEKNYGRRRLNVLAIVLCVLTPSFLFMGVFSLLTFSLHYSHPVWTNLVAYGVCSVGALLALSAVKKAQGSWEEKSWWRFFVVTCTVAWLLALVLGEWNYSTVMHPFFEVNNLNLYVDVNPAIAQGQQLMDAGRVVFSADARLDVDRSMGFRDDAMYCVAPVTTVPWGSATSAETYDFWAVGKNCCSGHNADFRCGEYANRDAKGGLRVMNDHDQAFYRLAVQQAEAAYGIKASHPLFFDWVQDPLASATSNQAEGFRRWWIWSACFSCTMLVLVSFAASVFAKLGSVPC